MPEIALDHRHLFRSRSRLYGFRHHQPLSMGAWTITIHGIGDDQSAIAAAETLVRALRQKGHVIESTAFTSGERDDLLLKIEQAEGFTSMPQG